MIKKSGIDSETKLIHFLICWNILNYDKSAKYLKKTFKRSKGNLLISHGMSWRYLKILSYDGKDVFRGRDKYLRKHLNVHYLCTLKTENERGSIVRKEINVFIKKNLNQSWRLSETMIPCSTKFQKTFSFFIRAMKPNCIS